jgi:hypothetical protein
MNFSQSPLNQNSPKSPYFQPCLTNNFETTAITKIDQQPNFKNSKNPNLLTTRSGDPQKILKRQQFVKSLNPKNFPNFFFPTFLSKALNIQANKNDNKFEGEKIQFGNCVEIPNLTNLKGKTKFPLKKQAQVFIIDEDFKSLEEEMMRESTLDSEGDAKIRKRSKTKKSKKKSRRAKKIKEQRIIERRAKNRILETKKKLTEIFEFVGEAQKRQRERLFGERSGLGLVRRLIRKSKRVEKRADFLYKKIEFTKEKIGYRVLASLDDESLFSGQKEMEEEIVIFNR